MKNRFDKERFPVNQPSRRSPGRPRSRTTDIPTQHHILAVATRLFVSEGFQKVSIDRIAEASGVTKATVYYYFNNKVQLFLEAISQLMGRVNNRIIAMLKDEAPLKERLVRIAEAHLAATASFNFDMDGFLRETKTFLTAEQIQLMKDAEDNIHRTITAAFKEEVEKGELPPIPEVFAARAFMGLLKACNDPDQGKPIFSSHHETARRIVDFVWNGLEI